MGTAPKKAASFAKSSIYENFSKLDGTHPLKDACPSAYVEYLVQTRRGGKVSYFNFNLAREMGLIPKDHPNQMSADLEAAALQAFSIQIINEYDLINHLVPHTSEIRPHTYMATRYLQLQHPGKNGATSGDGRSIWNGSLKSKVGTWDVSSCGTGATCLSPATAINQKFFQTGDPVVAYGCGYADFEEGLNAAVMSEIFHKNGVPTERTLCLITFDKGRSINVRASKNLLRPSHIFRYLKQGDHLGLKRIVDYFIDRQIENKAYPGLPRGATRYEYLLQDMAQSFARATATFENEYIFCWLDWDGDNVLAADAGIIDYGSVRQFGLYHREYRYDDVTRFSTSIPEQKKKAKYTVQNFAQLADFLITGKKKAVEDFREHASLRHFEKIFEQEKNLGLLRKMGLPPKAFRQLERKHKALVQNFARSFKFFEEQQSVRGTYIVKDGVSSDAVYCMRDILRELPKHLLAEPKLTEPKLVDADTFQKMGASSYAQTRDLELSPHVRKSIRQFQAHYLALVEKAAKLERKTLNRLLLEITMRSSVINKYERITGNGIIFIAEHLIRESRKRSVDEIMNVVYQFIDHQTLDPSVKLDRPLFPEHGISKLVQIARDHREGV